MIETNDYWILDDAIIFKPSFNNVLDDYVDILLKGDIKNKEQDIKSFVYFLKTLKITGIGEGIITKIYEKGYDDLHKIVNITKNELLEIDGIKEKSASNILNSLLEVKNKDCIDLLNASNMLGRGFGESRIKLIHDKYPFIFSDRKKTLNIKEEELITIDGISNIIARQFIDNIQLFYNFYDELGIKCIDKIVEKEKEISDNFFKDKIFVFSGFRNKDLELKISNNGGKVANTITKNTNYLIVKDIDEETTKIKQAKEKNINIILLDSIN